MFQFGFDRMLYVYALIPALVWFVWWANRRRREAMARFGDPALLDKLTRAINPRARRLKNAMLVAGVFFLVSALTRPQFGSRVETVRREGQDVIVALDVSASMLAEDIAPNRLEKAKHEIGRLIERLEGDRVGLVAFAGAAFMQAPLTVDYAAARMFLDAMDPDLIPVPGTSVAEALGLAVEAFPEDDDQHRVVVLLTDGEDHVGDIDEVVDRAMDRGVLVHTVGVGSSQGVPIPEFDENGRRRGFLRDDDGEVVTTRLDEATLRRIAADTGGRYFRATPGGQELRELADEIAGMEGRELDARLITQFEEQFQLFVGLALLLLAVELFVPERRTRREAWHGRFE